MTKITERIVLVVVAVIVVALMISSIGFERRMANQKLLYYQLLAVRTSVNLFKAMTRRNPASIEELVMAEYRFEGESGRHRYITSLPMDKKGMIVDPFDNPYYYNVENGWVRSQTRGYEYW